VVGKPAGAEYLAPTAVGLSGVLLRIALESTVPRVRELQDSY
jgi:hypothetical protein